MFYENNKDKKLTLYKMSFEDNHKWQVDFDWEWSGGIPLKNNSYFFVNANGKKKFPDQEEEIVVTEVKDLAQKNGMTPLREAGIGKIKDGVTTIEEVLRATVEDI